MPERYSTVEQVNKKVASDNDIQWLFTRIFNQVENCHWKSDALCNGLHILSKEAFLKNGKPTWTLQAVKHKIKIFPI